MLSFILNFYNRDHKTPQFFYKVKRKLNPIQKLWGERINKARNIKSGIKIWVESSHTLTVAELPAHTHGRGTQNITTGDQENIRGNCWGAYNVILNNGCFTALVGQAYISHANDTSNTSHVRISVLRFNAANGWSGTSESIGSDTAFSILPPYSVVYCFKRVL